MGTNTDHLVSEKIEQLGTRVRKYRKSIGLSQEMLAKVSHVSRYAVISLESGQGSGLSLENFFSILRGLGRFDAVDNLVPDVTPEFISELLKTWSKKTENS